MGRHLALLGVLCAFAISVVALPMGQAPRLDSPTPGDEDPSGMEGKCCRKPFAQPPAPGGGCMTTCVEVPTGGVMDCMVDLTVWSKVVDGACLPGLGGCSAGGTQAITVFGYRCLGPVACTHATTGRPGQRCKWHKTGFTRRVDAPSCTGVLCPN